MPSGRAPQVPLTGHLGLLDALSQALTTAGACASVLARNPEAADALADLRTALRRADAVNSIARDALAAGATVEQTLGTAQIDERDRDDWSARHAKDAWTGDERGVLQRLRK
jgi:hypothetical protein